MNSIIRSKVINIGNSRGLRIPKSLLEQAGLEDEVEMTILDNKLIIQTPHKPRQGWELQFLGMAENRDDQILDGLISTQWDEDEWEW